MLGRGGSWRGRALLRLREPYRLSIPLSRGLRPCLKALSVSTFHAARQALTLSRSYHEPQRFLRCGRGGSWRGRAAVGGLWALHLPQLSQLSRRKRPGALIAKRRPLCQPAVTPRAQGPLCEPQPKPYPISPFPANAATKEAGEGQRVRWSGLARAVPIHVPLAPAGHRTRRALATPLQQPWQGQGLPHPAFPCNCGKPKEAITTYRQQRSIHQRFDQLEAKIDRLLRSARAEKQRDTADMATTDEILAKLEAANTKQDAFLVILEELKANQDNPEKLMEIAASIDSQQADWEAAFAVNTPPEEPPVEPPVEPEPTF